MSIRFWKSMSIVLASALFLPWTIANSQATTQAQDIQKQETDRQPILDDAYDFSKAPELPPIDAPTREEIARAITHGVDYLLGAQNPDGSWGSPDAQRPFQIYAPIPGSHQAFRAAVTAMSVTALIESRDTRPETATAVNHGYEWLRENVGHVRRATGDAIYNVWAHLYSVQAFVRLHENVIRDEAGRKVLRDLILAQLEMLDRYESVDGGWGYYDFRYQARKPTSESTSFVNAAALVSMHEAAAIGIPMNEKTVDRAIKSTVRQQKPDFTYLYGEYLDKTPMMGINRPAGSLGRSQACNIALRLWGDKRITDNVLKNWLYRLYVRNGWLGIGRKRPIPHESWFQVAGYFYYFGHYYAAWCIQALPVEEQGPYQSHLAKIILQYQETDGSWWDYPMYGYHKPYGTAYAIMTLQRCLPKTDASESGTD